MSFPRHARSIAPIRESNHGRDHRSNPPAFIVAMSLDRIFLGRLLSSSEIPDRGSGQTGKEQAASQRRIRYAESGLSVGS